MKLYPWSCMTAAAALVLDVDEWDIHVNIGHNGGEVIRPSYADVRRYRGFHTQELIDVLLRHYKRSSALIDPHPRLMIAGREPELIFSDLVAQQRWERYLEDYNGVLFGQFPNKRCDHALAVIDGVGTNPDNGEVVDISYFLPKGYLIIE